MYQVIFRDHVEKSGEEVKETFFTIKNKKKKKQKEREMKWVFVD